jgi:yecA family protein
MSNINIPLHLPSYQPFTDDMAILNLPMSVSELHGMMCGYLCAGATSDGEAYLQALITSPKDTDFRRAALALFGVYAVSQQQLLNFDFSFQLLLPEDHESLAYRAQAFSEWCDGFTQGITLVGVDAFQLQEEEAQEALQHLSEFAQLDYHHLEFDEDERALMEVTEYTRMAVLRIHGDLLQANGSSETAH